MLNGPIPFAGQAWSDPETQTLREMWNAGKPVVEIAAVLGRTKCSVISRARKLGVPHPNRNCRPKRRVIWSGGPLMDGTPPPNAGVLSERATAARERHLAARAQSEAQINALRVNRDPCPKCAVRADIGCKHNPSPRRETDAHTQGAMS